MRSIRTREFRLLLAALPVEARRQAIAAYRLFLEDPFHPGLQFNRIGHDRAVGERNEDRVLWYWIGTHAEYDRLLRGR